MTEEESGQPIAKGKFKFYETIFYSFFKFIFRVRTASCMQKAREQRWRERRLRERGKWRWRLSLKPEELALATIPGQILILNVVISQLMNSGHSPLSGRGKRSLFHLYSRFAASLAIKAKVI